MSQEGSEKNLAAATQPELENTPENQQTVQGNGNEPIKNINSEIEAKNDENGLKNEEKEKEDQILAEGVIQQEEEQKELTEEEKAQRQAEYQAAISAKVLELLGSKVLEMKQVDERQEKSLVMLTEKHGQMSDKINQMVAIHLPKPPAPKEEQKPS